MSNPNKTHFTALDRVWKYLNKYPTIGLHYKCLNKPYLVGYTDSDWGGDINTRKSTSGYIYTFGKGNIISWNSILQKTVALSSCKSEYIALKEAITEAIYLKNTTIQLADILKIDIPYRIPTILVDNQSAIKLAENPKFHKRSKHIDITYYFIRQSIKENKATLAYINTKEQLADSLTKGLNNAKQLTFIEGLQLKTIQ